jgi:multiple sugar transport system substrate-binding protein
LLWALRSLFIAAALALTLWLFLGYQPPRTAAFPDREIVTLWHMWTGDRAKLVHNVVDQFNRAQQRYAVRAVNVAGGDVKTMIATAGGDPPDCLCQWDPVIPVWAQRGALTPLDQFMGPDQWLQLQQQLYPAALSMGTYKNHFYGLPISMNVWAIYYRPSHFQQAGLDPHQFPNTLEQLRTISEKLWQFDHAGRVTRIGFFPEDLLIWVPVFGGSLYDEKTDQLTLNTPRNVQTLSFLASFSHQYGFNRVQRFETGLWRFQGAGWPFITGVYSITIDGQWRIEELDRYAPDLDYLTAPIPPPAGGNDLASWSNGNFLVIPTGARNKNGAWAFMRFWAGLDDPQRGAEFCTQGGGLPISPAIAHAPAFQNYVQRYPQFQTFLDLIASPNVKVTPPVTAQAFLYDRLRWAAEVTRRGIRTPEQALTQIAAELDREMQHMQPPPDSNAH